MDRRRGIAPRRRDRARRRASRRRVHPRRRSPGRVGPVGVRLDRLARRLRDDRRRDDLDQGDGAPGSDRRTATGSRSALRAHRMPDVRMATHRLGSCGRARLRWRCRFQSRDSCGALPVSLSTARRWAWRRRSTRCRPGRPGERSWALPPVRRVTAPAGSRRRRAGVPSAELRPFAGRAGPTVAPGELGLSIDATHPLERSLRSRPLARAYAWGPGAADWRPSGHWQVRWLSPWQEGAAADSRGALLGGRRLALGEPGAGCPGAHQHGRGRGVDARSRRRCRPRPPGRAPRGARRRRLEHARRGRARDPRGRPRARGSEARRRRAVARPSGSRPERRSLVPRDGSDSRASRRRPSCGSSMAAWPESSAGCRASRRSRWRRGGSCAGARGRASGAPSPVAVLVTGSDSDHGAMLWVSSFDPETRAFGDPEPLAPGGPVRPDSRRVLRRRCRMGSRSELPGHRRRARGVCLGHAPPGHPGSAASVAHSCVRRWHLRLCRLPGRARRRRAGGARSGRGRGHRPEPRRDRPRRARSGASSLRRRLSLTVGGERLSPPRGGPCDTPRRAVMHAVVHARVGVFQS